MDADARADADSDGSDDAAPWVSLFSGGKDSSWALYRALEAGHPVERLVTVHPTGDSYMYHTPATELAALAAESVGVPLLDVRPAAFAESETDGGRASLDAGARGDAELEPLEAALSGLCEAWGAIGGVTAGAVESEFQTARIRGMCERLGAELFAPLYGGDPRALADAMLDAGFEIVVVAVAAGGLDESWLGRRLDREALADLERLGETYGVHLLGEGGEFETLVVDGPHMDRRIAFDAEPVWDGMRGHLRIENARLA
jgi:ABC transporter with metal-binding/Fe-S-binding domain ATP-binding protein